MLGNQKGLSTVVLLAVVTLLSSCSPASSFAFLPRVSRTKDAVVIDFTGVGYAPTSYGKTLYGQFTNPGFVPLPSVYGWPMPFGFPSFISPSAKQNDGEYEEYLDDPLTLKQTAPKCGTGPATMPAATRDLATERVAGGAEAKKNAWPFVVALKTDEGIFCSGTLLSDTKVLLAAQCLEKMSMYELSTVTVLVGFHAADLSDLQMTRRISKVVLHARYNAFTYANDIAIITLDSPVVLSRTVATACLPAASTDADQFVGVDAVILGWGTADGEATGNLKQAKTAISSNDECRADTNFGKYVSASTTCTTTGPAFTCAVDVGGPVVTLPTPGTWTVVAINSYTKDCAVGGLKTQVGSFRTWIDQYM